MGGNRYPIVSNFTSFGTDTDAYRTIVANPPALVVPV